MTRIQPSVAPQVRLAGIFDVGGNLFYVLAGQAGRMDIAAVLAWFYPGASVILAWALSKERIGRDHGGPGRDRTHDGVSESPRVG